MSFPLSRGLAVTLLVAGCALSVGFLGLMAQEPGKMIKGPALPGLIAPGLVVPGAVAPGREAPPTPAPKLGVPGLVVEKARNPAKLPVAQRNVYLCAQRAVEWLHKANRPDGRFVTGFVPALRVPLEGDDFLHQAGAAFALARSARFFEDERAGAIARQAVLSLLLETTIDPAEKHLRYSAAPAHLVNRPAATALLVLAILDLPAPAPDLLEQADQMTNYLRTLLAADGSVRVEDAPADAKGPKSVRKIEDLDPALLGAGGIVLYALAKSQEHRPAAWKLEALRKACPHYHGCWERGKNLPMVAWHAAAFTQAYLQTKEKAFADCVFAMNDWLCEQQYTRPEPQRGHWLGGFMAWEKGKMVSLPPDARGAEAAFSLAGACRLARAAGDAARLARYQMALETSLHFLATLQYTDASARHFIEEFRPLIVGGFHASHQDGDLRIVYAQNALLAQVEYLANLVEW